MIGIDDIVVTRHAAERMSEMKVTRQAILDAVTDPEMDYVAPKKHGDEARLACRGSIAVAYRPIEGEPSKRLIMTVLWNKKEFAR